jgi:hypothetical protein
MKTFKKWEYNLVLLLVYITAYKTYMKRKVPNFE